MSPNWWDDVLTVLSDPVYGVIIVSVLIFIAALVLVQVSNLFMSRWRKRLEEKARQSSELAVAPVKTRFIMVARIIHFSIYGLAAMLILLQIPQVRAIGATLLATAGVIGIVAGLAAQATLANLVAGISLAITQPIRLNDAVIYQGDWGRIEDITLSHTVIRTWDNRRLVIPNSIINSTVIQNWTLKEEWLLGAVVMYVDYKCDVELVRKWVKEIIDGSKNSTSERYNLVQVVDFTEKSMELRILGKAADSGSTWNLRCEIREKLISKFNQAGLPLPEFRIEQFEKGSGPGPEETGRTV